MSETNGYRRALRAARKAKEQEKIFTGGHGGDYPISCGVCNRRFARMNGTTSHGFMHVRNGDARAEITPERYEFYFAFEEARHD